MSGLVKRWASRRSFVAQFAVLRGLSDYRTGPGGENRGPGRTPLRTAPRTTCPLCGEAGKVVVPVCSDVTFGQVAGVWQIRRCRGSACEVLWLDPEPLSDDLSHAYDTYYTHAPRGHPGGRSLAARWYAAMKSGYWHRRYAYPATSLSPVSRLLWWTLYAFPLRRGSLDGAVTYLPAKPGGLLLDVGCGNGEALSRMRDLGWRVRGVDPDWPAVARAWQRGLDVKCGTIEEASFPENTFDAITLNHVIEHVSDPRGLLAECERVLKPDGILVVVTPNAKSLMAGFFKQYWRGLETPRHLVLYTVNAMQDLLCEAGLVPFRSWSFVGTAYTHKHSVAMARGRCGGERLIFSDRAVGTLLAFAHMAVTLAARNRGEYLAVMATKSPDRGTTPAGYTRPASPSKPACSQDGERSAP